MSILLTGMKTPVASRTTFVSATSETDYAIKTLSEETLFGLVETESTFRRNRVRARKNKAVSRAAVRQRTRIRIRTHLKFEECAGHVIFSKSVARHTRLARFA